MHVRRSDYAQIAAYYDQARGLVPQFAESQVGNVIRWGRVGSGDRVLDVGCGTGRCTLSLAARTGAESYGLEPEPEMLAKALAKPDAALVRWARGRAEQLPFADGAFDVVTLMMVIHHVTDRAAALREMHRVLRPGGRVVIFTASHGQIRRYALKDFRGVVAIDLQRFPAIPTLRGLLVTAGFSRVAHHMSHFDGGYVTTDAFLAQVRSKFISTLSQLSEETFARGCELCERRLRAQYGDRMPYTRTYTLVVGER